MFYSHILYIIYSHIYIVIYIICHILRVSQGLRKQIKDSVQYYFKIVSVYSMGLNEKRMLYKHILFNALHRYNGGIEKEYLHLVCLHEP